MAALVQLVQQHKARIYFFVFSVLFMFVIWYATKTYNFLLFGVPLAVIFAYFSFVNYKWLWYLTIFLMPLSITDAEFFGKIAGVTFPTDFLAIILLGLLLIKMISEPGIFAAYRGHPIPIVVGLQLLWLVFAAVPSSMPVVSWKYVVASVWMIGCFFMMPLLLFKDSKTIFRFLQLIVVAFTLAFGTIMMLFLSTGRNPFGLRFNPGPFFVDHTVFGAFTAMWVPILVLLAFGGEFKNRERWVARAGLLVFALALFFSYSRGAWASCVAALLMLGVVLLGKWARRFLLPVMMLGMLVGTFVWYANQGTSSGRNKAVSRKNFTEHIASVTNFRTDDSNRERINRWYCAWQMFLERPNFGFGPGTYSFQYGNFQKARSRTMVSTNRGDNGTAHNEFLLALSENGWPSAVILTFFFAIPFFRGLRGYNLAAKRNTRLLYLACTFGLLTYIIHAFVNNFMDQDKVGGTFLALMAMITALDVHYLPKEKGMIQEGVGFKSA
ncbi:MAG: O-antigen ligase family protein [Bacteroidetes bacterium]|nr:O-antigen ligase family protein [Bacteroidota bacterium]MBL0016874.1 O-antigen ligase family protein [Bacteroidota bacterium]